MRISDWSSDVCSSDLVRVARSIDAPQWPKLRIATTASVMLGIFSVVLAKFQRQLPEFAFELTTGDKATQIDRKSVVEGKSVSVSVDLGGRRLIQKKTNIRTHKTQQLTKTRKTH